MDAGIKKFADMVKTSNNIVFFGGAGVSTESGIPDFRSKDGLYSRKYDYPPEMMVSHSFYESHTDEFFKFYKDRMIVKDAEPNITHLKLAKLEQEGKLRAVVTQNIDGLHQAAGSRRVFELHGSILRSYCEDCNQFYDVDYVLASDGIPRCLKCGGIVKPDVVLYEESLDSDVITAAVMAISAADMLIVGGTSLVVYPAAGLVNYYSGNKLVLINRDVTAMDGRANLVLHKSLGEVFSAIE